jgi:arylsulfatase A-like enzyme
MRAFSLVLVLILAKLLGVIGSGVPWSPSAAAALVWHDVACGLVFWCVDRASGRHALMWAPYWAIVVLAAVNVGVVRTLSSPLTWPMLGAAGAALSDSVLHHASLVNLTMMALVVAAGVIAPRAARLQRPSPGTAAALLGAGALIAGTGMVASWRVDVRGLHRNGVTALVTTALPRIDARHSAGEWRLSPVGRGPMPMPASEDLRAMRGTAAGRHVVLIVLESTAARYLHSYGAPDDPMPRLTAFAEQALQFERTYAVYPESIKGLFATMCARAPALDVTADVHARAPCVPLPRTLGRMGYRTALFHSGRFGYLGMGDIVSNLGFDTREDAGAIGGNLESSFGVDEPSTVARMFAWIDALPPERPFLLTYLPVAGHHPYDAPGGGPFVGEGDLSAYKNALHDGDRSIGTIVDGLRARGLDRRTLFVIYGDHGEAFGQHAGNYGHSLFVYDENIRVPLLVSAPGVTTDRRRIGRVASLIDVAPTILDLLGAEVPASGEGASLLDPVDRLALFYTDYSAPWLGLQDGCTKYLRDLDAGRDRLYDTCVDPGERIDHAPSRADDVRAYRDHIQRWAETTREAIVNAR